MVKIFFNYWLRWILAVPVAVAIGGLANLFLLGIVSIFINLKTADDNVVNILNLLLFPLIIGFISVHIGSKIAPKYCYKTAIILFGIVLLMQIVGFFIAPLSEENTSVIEAVLTVIGGVAGVLFVKKHT